MRTALLTFNATAYPADTYHPPHQHGELQLSLVMRGEVAESARNTTEYAGPLSVVVKDAGAVHSDRFGPNGAQIVRLSLKHTTTLADIIDDSRRSIPWRWLHDPAAAAPFLRLVCRAHASPCEFAADDSDVIDLLAIVTAHYAQPTSVSPPAWLARTMAWLREEWDPSISVADVAQRAGVHPVYLARCVRRWYGTGVSEELRRRRLKAATRAIAVDGETISHIAHLHGFADEPHLCREFHRTTGLPPRRYRQLVRSIAFRPSGH